jgi:hypothetical protein
VGTVTYSVLTGEGDEGFLKGKDGKPLVWDKSNLPLTCMYEGAVGDHLYELEQARRQIVEKVGGVIEYCSAWQLSDPFPTKTIRGAVLLKLATPDEIEGDGVYISSPWDIEHGGTTKLFTDTKTGKLYGVIIYVNPNVPKELRERVWLHELLHAFGLGHDRLKGSIMYPSAAGRPKEMSKRDIQRLKEAYTQ